MMYEEFTRRAKRPITPEQYKLVEYVYTWHPAIADKDQCAALYDLAGLAVFTDMKPSAERAEAIENELLHVRNRQHELEILRQAIKLGARESEAVVNE